MAAWHQFFLVVLCFWFRHELGKIGKTRAIYIIQFIHAFDKTYLHHQYEFFLLHFIQVYNQLPYFNTIPKAQMITQCAFQYEIQSIWNLIDLSLKIVIFLRLGILKENFSQILCKVMEVKFVCHVLLWLC